MLCLGLGLAAWAESPAPQAPRPEPELIYPPGPGAKVAQARCTSCHGAETFLNARLDAKTWQKAVHKELTERGAVLSAGEKRVLMAYLIQNFRPDTPPHPPHKVVIDPAF